MDSLRDMKAMAIDSANDHNSETDRAIIQKVFAQHIEQIDDIAATTNYNGINLLDGRWREPGGYTISSNIEGESGTEPVGPLMPHDPVAMPVRPTGSPIIIPSGDYTITADGVYKLASGYTGKITIDAENVELSQFDDQLSDVLIECKKENTNLWLNGIRVGNQGLNPVVGSFIRFGTGTDNTLNLVGQNFFITNTTKNEGNACINVGGGLTIFDGDGTGQFGVGGSAGSQGAYQQVAIGAVIGSDAYEPKIPLDF